MACGAGRDASASFCRRDKRDFYISCSLRVSSLWRYYFNYFRRCRCCCALLFHRLPDAYINLWTWTTRAAGFAFNPERTPDRPLGRDVSESASCTVHAALVFGRFINLTVSGPSPTYPVTRKGNLAPRINILLLSRGIIFIYSLSSSLVNIIRLAFFLFFLFFLNPNASRFIRGTRLLAVIVTFALWLRKGKETIVLLSVRNCKKLKKKKIPYNELFASQ